MGIDTTPTLDRYVVVVTCVVLFRSPHDGELEALILKRSGDEAEGPGLWTIPGGRVDRADWGVPGTSSSHKRLWHGVLDRATKREIKEETGILISTITLDSDCDCIFLREDGTATLVLRYHSTLEQKPRIVLGKELDAHAWVKHADLARYSFIGNVGEEISDLMQCLAT